VPKLKCHELSDEWDIAALLEIYEKVYQNVYENVAAEFRHKFRHKSSCETSAYSTAFAFFLTAVSNCEGSAE
jgi:hypothetical protein